jgi:hypothetical protein
MSYGLDFIWKENKNDSNRVDSKVKTQKIVSEMRYNFKDRNNIFAKMELIRIQQTGASNSAATYELMEGFRKGINFYFQSFVTWYLTSSLELSVNYDLRASQGARPLHSGRMQVRALF